MPTVLRSGPYRFFFYAGDGNEPAHVHVERDDAEAKFWLDPIRLERSHGFKPKELAKIQVLIGQHKCGFWRVGMASSATDNPDAFARHIVITDDTLSVELADGRTIAAPLAWYPRLSHATSKERSTWRLIAGGRGIHWPLVDEDISVQNLLAGQPSAESQASLKKWLAERNKKQRRKPVS